VPDHLCLKTFRLKDLSIGRPIAGANGNLNPEATLA
jgi:hypothetical protein